MTPHIHSTLCWDGARLNCRAEAKDNEALRKRLAAEEPLRSAVDTWRQLPARECFFIAAIVEGLPEHGYGVPDREFYRHAARLLREAGMRGDDRKPRGAE